MKDVLAVIAALIAIAGNLPYIKDAFTKKVKPHPYTWLVWTIVSAIVFFGQIAKGAGIGALPAGIAEIFTVIIFIFSLRYGFKYVSKTDTYFLVAALLGIVPWIIFDNPTISVIIAVSIDLVAFVPTLRKTYLHPETETPILYGSNVLRHILTLLSLQAYNIATMLHSIAMIITNTTMVGLILQSKLFKREAKPLKQPKN
jgi:hydrogenase-4 membrane subunit HyfE